MSTLQIVGITLYMAGHGYRSMPGTNSGVLGSACMIVGALIFLVGGLV